MGIIVSYGIILLGVIGLILSFIFFKRKSGEVELSRSIANVPVFWIGLILTIVGVILSGMGFLAQKYGVLQILFIAGILPAFCAYFVKYLKEIKE